MFFEEIFLFLRRHFFTSVVIIAKFRYYLFIAGNYGESQQTTKIGLKSKEQKKLRVYSSLKTNNKFPQSKPFSPLMLPLPQKHLPKNKQKAK